MSAPAAVEPSPVRARRAPALEPPYDDEAQALVHPLAQPGRGPRTQRPVTPRRPREPHPEPAIPARPALAPVPMRPAPTAPTAPTAPAAPARPDGSAGPRSLSASDDPRARPAVPARPAAAAPPATAYRPAAQFQPTPAQAAAQRFVGVCVEILNGHRPASHLRAVVAAPELHLVADQLVRRTTRAYLGRPGATSTRPLRVRVRALHVGEPRDGVAEVVAVLEYGVTHWAMCARLERRSDTWLCTLVQVV